jgi:F-type H+-transporting ATPase subunit b
MSGLRSRLRGSGLLAATVLAGLLGVAASAPAAPTPSGPAGEHAAPPAESHDEPAGHGEPHALPDYPGCGFGGMNLWCGFIGEKQGVQPDAVWRAPGMPVPLLASFINAGVLFYVLVRMGKKPVLEGLAQRKKTILGGMQEAARMKDDAQRSLRQYQAKLERIDEEIDRLRREMKEAGDAERERVIAEARERRARMERDARLLVDQEAKATRERLLQETADGAMKSAVALIQKSLGAGDQHRLADEHLAGLAAALGRRVGAAR